MNRTTVRHLSHLAVILALAILLASPVLAGPVPLDAPPSAEQPREEPDWFDAALSFVSQMLEKKGVPPLPELPLLGPSTGSCIDPLGNPCVWIPGL